MTNARTALLLYPNLVLYSESFCLVSEVCCICFQIIYSPSLLYAFHSESAPVLQWNTFPSVMFSKNLDSFISLAHKQCLRTACRYYHSPIKSNCSQWCRQLFLTEQFVALFSSRIQYDLLSFFPYLVLFNWQASITYNLLQTAVSCQKTFWILNMGLYCFAAKVN